MSRTDPKYTSVTTATTVSEGPDDAPLNPYASELPFEAQQRTWDDTFFDCEGADEIIAVFDFDYALMEDFNTKVGFASLLGTLLYPPLFGLALLGCTPCFIRRNVEWSARAQHVALTRDGIRFVRDRRPTCWGLSCTDAGRSSKTVPYDQITDCDVEEPAGNTCLCIPNVLATVNIDTASSGGPAKELRISGLKDPVGFKRLVWAMKRFNAGRNGATLARGVVAESMMDRSKGDGASVAPSAGQESESIAFLLREIRDELRELRKSKDENAVQTATEVVELVAASANVEAEAEALSNHNIV